MLQVNSDSFENFLLYLRKLFISKYISLIYIEISGKFHDKSDAIMVLWKNLFYYLNEKTYFLLIY